MRSRTTIDFGIYLGCRNSSIAVFEGRDVMIIKNNVGDDMTPSAIFKKKTGDSVNKIIGTKAKQMLGLKDEFKHVATEFKQKLGLKDWSFEFPSTGEKATAVDLSAEIIRDLVNNVKLRKGEDVSAALITVPAAFLNPMYEDTKKAGEKAGIKYVEVLEEPIAVALAYGLNSGTSSKGRWLTYDLGSGTFDAALVKIEDGIFSVFDQEGLPYLGGKSLDALVVEKYLVPALPSNIQEKIIPWKSSSWWTLKFFAEEAKCQLSTVNEYIFDNNVEGHDFVFTLTRKQLDVLESELFATTIAKCHELLNRNKFTPSDIDKVVLIGDPTLSPHLREMIEQGLGVPVDFSIDPVTAVVKGAAIYAAGRKIPDDILKNIGRKTEGNRKIVMDTVLNYPSTTIEEIALVTGTIKLKNKKDDFTEVNAENISKASSEKLIRKMNNRPDLNREKTVFTGPSSETADFLKIERQKTVAKKQNTVDKKNVLSNLKELEFRDILSSHKPVDVEELSEVIPKVPDTVVRKISHELLKDIGRDTEEKREHSMDVDLNYPSTTMEQDAMLTGIINPKDKKVEISVGWSVEITRVDKAGNALWTSNKVSVTEKGSFAKMVSLEEGKNVFNLAVMDAQNKMVTTYEEFFTITVTIGSDVPELLPRGIGIANEYGKMMLFFEKHTILPAEKIFVLKTANELKKGEKGEALYIPVLEGNEEMAHLNRHIDTLKVEAESIPKSIPKDSEVEITINIDVSRTIVATAYFESCDFEVSANMSTAMDIDLERLSKDFDDIQNTITKLEKVSDGEIKQVLENVKKENVVEDIENLISRTRSDNPEIAAQAMGKILELRKKLESVREKGDDLMVWGPLHWKK